MTIVIEKQQYYKEFINNIDIIFGNLSKNFNLEKQRYFDVAVSGGVDSISLLYCLANLIKTKNLDITLNIITVNHRLRSEAIDECQHVVSIADEITKEINCCYSIIDLGPTDNDFKKSQNSLRKLRFNEIAKIMKGKFLFLGHHLDDTIETIVMRSEKQSGLLGLAGIAAYNSINYHEEFKLNNCDYKPKYCNIKNLCFNKSIILIRPFITLTKDSIIQMAIQNKWGWLEDKSNSKMIYTRNIYRRQLMSDNKLKIDMLLLWKYASKFRNSLVKSVDEWLSCYMQINFFVYSFDSKDLNQLINNLTETHTETLKNVCDILTRNCFKLNGCFSSFRNYIAATILQILFNKLNSNLQFGKHLTAFGKLYCKITTNTSYPAFTIAKHIVKIQKNQIYILKESCHSSIVALQKHENLAIMNQNNAFLKNTLASNCVLSQNLIKDKTEGVFFINTIGVLYNNLLQSFFTNNGNFINKNDITCDKNLVYNKLKNFISSLGLPFSNHLLLSNMQAVWYIQKENSNENNDMRLSADKAMFIMPVLNSHINYFVENNILEYYIDKK